MFFINVLSRSTEPMSFPPFQLFHIFLNIQMEAKYKFRILQVCLQIPNIDWLLVGSPL
nr:hypothetical protein Iba_chr02aCG1620 [Ipomoea batatas]